jgi:hypothetical protein
MHLIGKESDATELKLCKLWRNINLELHMYEHYPVGRRLELACLDTCEACVYSEM